MTKPPIKIKLPQFIYEQFQRVRTADSIMERYYEEDKSKPNVKSEFKEVTVKNPWGEE